MTEEWRDLDSGASVTPQDALERLASGRAALLGEQHDRAEDHRWQAATLAGLAALREVMVGFEMFPRRAQPALDDWTAGRLDEDAFLEATRWREVWGFDAVLYMPLFVLCRDRSLPMVALNIDRPLVSAIGRDGWEAIPPEDRGWLTPAAPASREYRRYLFAVTGGARPGRQAQGPEDPAFDRFVRAQQAWDRAFACALAGALAARPDALGVGIIGRGHVEYGGGVQAQLADLGVGPVASAVTSPAERGMASLACDFWG